MFLVSFLGIYLLSTGISWAFFTYINKESSVDVTQTPKGKSRIDPSLPKTESCPINGKLYSVPERKIWEERRPMTAIIENHADARPQSGLSYADVVYEAVAEGGITRFLSVFYCGASQTDVRIAPIRSVRVYYVDWASEYTKYPIFVHSGGANSICKTCPGGVKPYGDVAREVDAFRLLEKMGWRIANGNDLDAGTNVGQPAVLRNQYRLGDTPSAWEHSYEGYTDELFDEAKKRGFVFEDSKGRPWNENFISWKFTDDKPLSSPKASEISFEFWSNKSDYDVIWKYNSSGNKYIRFNGGKEHIDFETKEQLSAKNVVVQFVKERGPVDKEGHMVYTTIGEGTALVFQNGDVIEAKWKKRSQDDRTRFFTTKGDEISFVKGEIWMEMVPAGNKVNY